MHTKILPGARRFFLATILLSAACFPATAQTSTAAAPSPKPAASLASLPIFPLSLVHRGLHGTAYTVLEGSTPEPIPVEILGVLNDAIGPGKDMILARLTGAKAEYDGVVAGMSGSPVYIDGKLVGAIGYRVGQFTKQPIAGITPIQQMLDVIDGNNNEQGNYNRQQSSPNDPGDSSGFDAVSPALVSGISATAAVAPNFPGRDSAVLQPIETPLVFDGFSPATIDMFQRRFGSLGFMPVSGLGGASPNAPDSAPVVPGSAISAIIISGDFNMAATCTVTYVDPRHLLACGHPITRFGDVSLPMSKSVVVATVASSLSPMKIVNTTETVGSFTEDRESGILGVFGKPAHMIPVTLAIRGSAQSHTYHFAVVEHPRLTPGALIASVYEAMQDTNSYNDPSTYHLQGAIHVAGYPAVRIDDRIAPTDALPSSLAAAVVIAQRFDGIFSNPRETPDIQSMSFTLDETPGRHSATLADAYVLDPTVHAGERVAIEATLHPYRQPQRVIRFSVRLPDTLAPGPVRLLVSDGATLDHTLHLIPNPAAPSPGLREAIARLNQLHATDRLYVTLLAPVPQAMLNGRDLPSVPLTMANVLQPDENGATFTIDGETAIPLGAQPLDLALSGSRVITVNVRP
ncbi:MAG: SpoIVB peptidase S55 domain-containing protein [Acidobacteriaceae bacterium]